MKRQGFELWMLYSSCTCRIFSFEYIASDGIISLLSVFKMKNRNSTSSGIDPHFRFENFEVQFKRLYPKCAIKNTAEHSLPPRKHICPVWFLKSLCCWRCSFTQLFLIFSSLRYRVPQFNLFLWWTSSQDLLLTWGYHLQPWSLHPSILPDLTPHRCLQVPPFLKEINTVIQEGCIELVNSGSKYITLQIILFQINAVLMNFLFIKES